MSENNEKVLQFANKVFKNSNKAAILPPNLLIQGSRCKTLRQGPTTGASRKSSGGPSIGKKQ